MKFPGHILLKTIGACAALALGALAHAGAGDDYPRQPVQLVVGYGAGGGTDMCFRALAMTASKELGQSMVVENKPGAGSSLSVAYLTRQAPDGYSIAALSTGAVLNQFLNKSITYDVQKDIQPIAMVAQYQVGLLVRQDAPWKSLEDVIRAAKAKPKSVAYSTAGVGTPQHLTMVRLGEAVSADWVHAPYKSGPEAITALLRGDVDVMAQTAEWVPYVRDNRLRLLSVFTEKRIAAFPDAPTLVEAGYTLVAPSILGVIGPKGMDPKVVKKIDLAFKRAIDTEQFRNCADQFGLKTDYKNAEEFTAYIKNTVDEWSPLIRSFAAD
ncbi:tripartite tricarboxylate transporter substrate binding protein [Pollutimonas bauzanensis]|uniref:Tripartite-type tricarboxylate transporter, receptor component TctC n=1 Tax=Pollutimonas bauzanensis TaxID=658167 RepID=A0A1M5V4K1_9BURK|nr:tripartite tricarboxylate transporter substrate binding protein [Pollutimonas bauzanensis]SHH70068.1 Tripartite-type tricarboxylate transporter, receptor component TctC [Pollutimonas bauzanensis]